ncbi:MAG: succinylglutamate desuccinylase/aspartoacylase family protein, partial [Halobacteriales archaeon]
GSEGTLRREATDAGVPTVTIEMGEAHRFERPLIDHAIEGVHSVFAEFGLDNREEVRWPGWSTVIRGWGERTWLRADEGGLVEMHFDRGALVHEGEPIASITNPFGSDRVHVEAPFTGLLVGILENPVVYPGNPVCHLVQVDESTEQILERRRGIDHGTVAGAPDEGEMRE